MHVDSGVLSLAFSAVSTLVVVIGALAAVRQLRYLRHGNEMHALAEFDREFHSAAMVRDREFVRSELHEALQDASFVAELRAMPMGPRAQHFARLANFFERIAIYSYVGAISEYVAMMQYGNAATGYWPIMRDAIAIVRSGRTTAVLDYFEDFAMRAPAFLAREHRRRRRPLQRDPEIASSGTESAHAPQAERVGGCVGPA
jgi:hypothetical protein